MDRRKLNTVFTKPHSCGFITVCGTIGHGKTREEVVLQEKVKTDDVRGCVIEWNHRRGELWRIVEESIKGE